MVAIQIEKPMVTKPNKKAVSRDRYRRHRVIKYVSHVDHSMGIGVLVIAYLMNLLMLLGVAYGNIKDAKLSASKTNATENIVTVLNDTKNSGKFMDETNRSSKVLQLIDLMKLDHFGIVALLVCTYMVSLYGMVLFWNNFKHYNGTTRKSKFSFLIKLFFIKTVMLLTFLASLEFIATEEHSTIMPMHHAILIFSVGLLLTTPLFSRVNVNIHIAGKVDPTKKTEVTTKSVPPYFIESDYVPMRAVPPSHYLPEDGKSGFQLPSFSELSSPNAEILGTNGVKLQKGVIVNQQ